MDLRRLSVLRAFTPLIIFSACSFFGFGLPTTVRGAPVDFNTTGDLDANFNHTATLPFAEADAVGLGNPASRGLTVTGTADSGATFKTSAMPFDTVGSRVNVSEFFHTGATLGNTGENRIFELNVVSLNTSIVTGAHTGIGAKLEFGATGGADADNILIRFRRDNADVATSLSTAVFDILPNRWYKATFSALNQGTAADIPSSLVIDDYGVNGTGLVAANVFSHSFNIPIEAALTADPDVFGAFRVRNGTRLLAGLDNFEQIAIPVPEPSTWLLALLGCAGLLARRVR